MTEEQFHSNSLDEGTRLVIKEIAREVVKEVSQQTKNTCHAARMFEDKEDRNLYYTSLNLVKNNIEIQKELICEIKKLKGRKLVDKIYSFMGGIVGGFTAFFSSDYLKKL